MMGLIDTSYLSAFQPHPVDYVQFFTRGFDIANALPFSPENRRKRALEDFQIQMKQQQFAAQQAEQMQQMKMREALFPFQLQRAQRLASGVADSPTTQGGLQNYIAALRAATQQGGPETLPAPIEQPTPQPMSPPPPFGVDPDAPVF